MASPNVHAILIIEGEWSSTFSRAFDLNSSSVVSASSSPIPGISGAFEASFDDSSLNGVGTERLKNLDILTSLSISPTPIEATTLNQENSLVNLTFRDGVLLGIRIGGASGGPDGFQSNSTDFLVDFIFDRSNPSGPLSAINTTFVFASQDIIYSSMDSTNGSARNASANPNPVPEPTTLALLASGLLFSGLLRTRRLSS